MNQRWPINEGRLVRDRGNPGKTDLEIRSQFDPHYVDIRYAIPHASTCRIVPTKSHACDNTRALVFHVSPAPGDDLLLASARLQTA